MKHADIAAEFGISPTMVEKESSCRPSSTVRNRLGRKVIRRFGPGLLKEVQG